MSLRMHLKELKPSCLGVLLDATHPKATKPGGAWGNQNEILSFPFCFEI